MSAAAPLLSAIYRTGSFSTAAEDLGQTQSSVSHKIRSLEEVLGYALFSRTTRQVEPTRQGELICRAAQICVETLSDALDRVARANTSHDMVLSLPSSLAMKWLVPAMSRAQDRGLGLTLQIDDSLSEIGGVGQAQMAIRFGAGPYPGLHAQSLSKCAVVAVSAKAGRRLADATRDRPARLLRDIRAQEDGTGLTWSDYLQKSSMDAIPTEGGVQFERTDLALQASIGGLGYALGRTLLIEADVGDGLLVMDGPVIALRSRYWLVTSADYAQTESYQRVSGWLVSEVKRSAALLSAFA